MKFALDFSGNILSTSYSDLLPFTLVAYRKNVQSQLTRLPTADLR